MKTPIMPYESTPTSRIITILGFVIITGVLYLAREILIPIAMAVLISFLLSPLVLYLERRKVRRSIAVVVMVTLLLGMVGGIGYLLAGQFVEFVDNLPKYRTNIVTKIHAVKPGRESVFKRAEAIMADLSHEMDSDTTGTDTATSVPLVLNVNTSGKTSGSATEMTTTVGLNAQKVNQAILSQEQTPVQPAVAKDITPSDKEEAMNIVSDVQSGNNPIKPDTNAVPVKIISEPASAWQSFQDVVGPVIAILGNAGLVVLFVIFFLIQREDLRDRVIRLAGQNKVRVTTEALEEASKRVSRYLLMQLIVNVTYGIPVAIGLFFIGVPNAFLWGVMATILRFIPYIGPWIAASMPIALSLAVFDNWTMPMLTIGLFVVIELISNNLMEPILYGHSTGVSPVAIIVSAVFWTWLWGAVGLVLSTPITVCLVVMGSYVPQLGFLQVLLGDEPVLSEDARVYNRLLSGTSDEAVEIAEEYGEKHTLQELYDNVLLPALESAETDRSDNLLSPERYNRFITGMNELIEVSSQKLMADQKRAKEEITETENDSLVKESSLEAPLPVRKVLCVPVNDATDESAGIMLSHLLVDRGVEVRVTGPGILVSEIVDIIAEFEANIIVLSSVPPFAVTHARYLAKRISSHYPEIKLYAGLWRGAQSLEKSDERLKEAGVQQIYTSISDAGLRI